MILVLISRECDLQTMCIIGHHENRNHINANCGMKEETIYNVHEGYYT
jgi:hypothetical protein